jgi:hypothetical protein
MPDITMCSPERIEKICRKCHRLNATPDKWQSYTRFTPFKDGKSCEYYMPPRKGDRSLTK